MNNSTYILFFFQVYFLGNHDCVSSVLSKAQFLLVNLNSETANISFVDQLCASVIITLISLRQGNSSFRGSVEVHILSLRPRRGDVEM